MNAPRRRGNLELVSEPRGPSRSSPLRLSSPSPPSRLVPPPPTPAHAGSARQSTRRTRESGRLRGAPCGGFPDASHTLLSPSWAFMRQYQWRKNLGVLFGSSTRRSCATRRRISPAPERRSRRRSRRCSVPVRASMRRRSVRPSPRTARGRRRNPKPPYAATLRGRRKAMVHCRSSRRSPFRRAAIAPARQAGPNTAGPASFRSAQRSGTMMLVDSFSFGMPASRFSRASA